MRRLARAAEAWIWVDVAMKVTGVIALGGMMVAVWMALVNGAKVLGL